jgi:hypothetical protein
LKHEFHVGQLVELVPNTMRSAATGPYEITCLMPEPDVGSESPRYRIKSSEEIYQRIVSESDMMLLTAPMAELSLDMSRETLPDVPGIAAPPIED